MSTASIKLAFLSILIILSSVALAQDDRTLARKGCPVVFTVPDDWTGDATRRCVYTFTHDQQKIEITLYSGSIGDAEMLYWSANDAGEEGVADLMLGPYKAKHRAEPEIYLASNGDLVAFATTEDTTLEKTIETLLSTMVFTGRSTKASPKLHPKLFAGDCGVAIDYPRDLIAKPGPKRCSVELYSAWPPAILEAITLQVADSAFPEEFCVSPQEITGLETQVKTTRRPGWIFFDESGSRKVYGPSGYQGLGEWEAWIFSDGCHRSLTVSNPSEPLRKMFFNSLKFAPSTCKKPISRVPRCRD